MFQKAGRSQEAGSRNLGPALLTTATITVKMQIRHPVTTVLREEKVTLHGEGDVSWERPRSDGHGPTDHKELLRVWSHKLIRRERAVF